MEILIPALIVIAVSVFIAFRLYQQRELQKRGEEYEQLLKEARSTRFQYLQALQTTREALKEQERLEEILTSLKAELLGYNSEFRALLVNMRAQISKSTNSELDVRTVEQMKLTFAERWAVANTRKKDCLQIKADLAAARFSFYRLEAAEREITATWKDRKDMVFAIYFELKDKLKIADPKKFLN